MDQQSCLNPKTAFNDLYIFVECFNLWSDGRRDNEIYIVERQNNPFGQAISSCITEYCLNPQEDLGGCGDHDLHRNSSLGVIMQPVKSFSSVDCATVNGEVDKDIAGPGVAISYIMQAGHLYYLWLMMRGLQFLPAIVGYFTDLRHGRGLNLMTKDPRSEERRACLTRKFAEHLGVVRHALVEFQEAQCFFMIAIEAASLISLSTSESFSSAPSFLQYIRNISLIQTCATGGIVPITAGLLLLWSIGLNSWYILICSLVTICMSGTSYGMARDMYFGEAPDQIAFPSQTTGLEKCGYKQPPLIWCNSDGETSSDSLFRSANIAALTIFGMLVTLHLWPLGKRLIQPHSSLCQHQMDWSSSRWMRLIARIFYAVAESILFAMTVEYSYVMAHSVRKSPSTWNFGQLVSLFLWAPISSKYLSWALFGTAVYSATRFPAPFKIYNMNDSTASYRYTETDSDPDIGKEVAVANCGVRESHSNAGINRTQTV